MTDVVREERESGDEVEPSMFRELWLYELFVRTKSGFEY